MSFDDVDFSADSPFGDMTDIIQLDEAMAASTPSSSLDWSISSVSTPFMFDSLDNMLIQTHKLSFPLIQNPPPPSQALIVGASDAHFAALSKVNSDLHSARQSLGSQSMNSVMTLETVICGLCDENENVGRGINSIQTTLRAIQEYAITVKAPHRKHGIHHRPTNDPSTPQDQNSSSMTYQDVNDPPWILDSPTALLVISCFSQMISFLEFVLSVFNTRLSDFTAPEPSAGRISLADVPLLEFSSQLLIYAELINHLLKQIMLVLGLPVSWPGKSTWIGLLTTQRYRELLNAELGSVEGMWSARPAKVLGMIDALKGILLMQSMSGYT